MHDNTNLDKNREVRDKLEVYIKIRIDRISTGI